MSHAAWAAVAPYLRASRRVIAFDIAGFGATPPLPAHVQPTVANLVDALEHALREIGLVDPVDIAGNSLGGVMALEAARRGLARSAAAISPIGLWQDGPPPHVRYVFQGLRFTATRAPRLVKAAVRRPLLRELMLAVPLSIGSRRMPAEDAVRSVDDIAAARAFESTFEHTRAPFCGAGITVPVTVVFGGCDWILTSSARRRSALPPHTTWIDQPRWGHVPMWADPAGVAAFLEASTSFESPPPGSRIRAVSPAASMFAARRA
jgi:pimeloyl-ACP methyl ester carboxylesterase